MPSRIVKNVFNAGELSEYLAGRTDLSKYYNGCSVMVNATALPYGGVVKRPGTEFIARAKEACIVIPFEFSASDNMIIEMGNLYMRFYELASGETSWSRVMEDATDITAISLPSAGVVSVTSASHGLTTGDTVRFASIVGTTELNYDGTHTTEFVVTRTGDDTFTLDGTDGDDYTAYTSGGTVSAIHEIVTPFAYADVYDLHFLQSADVIYFTHVDYHPQKLSRLANNSWTIADIDFEGGPFLVRNTDDSKTLTFTDDRETGTCTAADATGAVLTDSAATFTVDGLIGATIYNTTDASSGLITDNTATTITATLSGGLDNDWGVGDTYTVLGASERGTCHCIGDTGTFVASGTSNTPFLSTHVGSLWELTKTVVAVGYDTLTTDGTSIPIEIKGDFSLDCAGFSTTTTPTVVKLQRKEGDGDWQEYRSFKSATAYSATEDEDDVLYRFILSGAGNLTSVTLTAKEKISRGIVQITSVTNSTTAHATAVSPVFRDSEADITPTAIEDGHTAGLPVFVTKTGHGLSAGDIVIFKDITNASFSYLSYSPIDDNYYVVGTKTANDFYLCGTADAGGNNASQNSNIGEFYHMKEDTSTTNWSEGSWSDYRGFPDTLTFFEDRLWFAGSAYQPQTLWASKSSEYENFTSGDLDSDSLSYTINDSDVSNIEWLAADEVLLCGTSKKEYKVSANSVDDPVTPSDIKVRPQSSHGSLGIQPIMLNNALFFAQGQGKKMRAMRFTDALNRFKSDDATLLANHMLENVPVQLAAQRIPDSIIWCVREDGVLCSFTYEPDEEVAAWARHITGYPQSSSALKGNAPPVHLFKSVAVTRGDEEDTVTCVVKRGDNYNIEQFSTRFFDEPDEALMLDSAIVSESGTDAINITYASDTVRYGAGEYGSGIYGV